MNVQALFEQLPNLSLVLLGLITLLTVYFHGPVFSIHTAHNAPSILTSLGIFGTFVGVAIGLMDFNTDNIQASVPALIDGLKTAFWTSIAGIFGALTIKFRFALHMIRKGNQVSRSGATLEDVVNEVRHLGQSISGEADDSLVSMWRAQQGIVNGHLESLQSAMEDFEVRMTEANTKALIKAIDHVMTDFNAQIDQQYGENFRQLNESVGKMQVWQEQNMSNLHEIIDRQKESAMSMVDATQAFSQLVNHSHVFTQVARDMESMLTGLHSQSSALAEFAEQLSGVINNAQQGLPDLEKRILSVTEHLQESMVSQQRLISDTLVETSQQIRSTVNQACQTLNDAYLQSQNSVNQELKELIALNQRQLKDLDAAMEQELTKALKTFGYQMTALSEKFVNDYTPLTDRLKELVSMAEEQS
ncbi:hypothetical protein [Gynuella sp.]|uniref:hypothetical protein n=1 Tax=Gynuella sp. TaxID=2969146 RepID=UPI003D0E8BE9